MPRHTDIAQLEKVKQTTIQLITQKGFEKTTVADIAKAADVATGYIYRHYKGKQGMVQSIFEERTTNFERMVNEMIGTSTKTEDLINEYIQEVFRNARENNVVYRFMFLMAQDKYFGNLSSRKAAIQRVCENILSSGQVAQDFAPFVNAEMIRLVLLSLPQQLVEHRMDKDGKFQYISTEDENRMIELCTQALLKAP